MTTLERLLDPRFTFDEPLALGALCFIVLALVLTPLLVIVLRKRGMIGDTLADELTLRTRSWAVIAPLVVGPILLGAFWAMGMVLLLALLCYVEFARMVGLFRDRLVSWTVLIGIVAVHFAALDHWYELFVALGPLVMVTIAAVALLSDQPKGYVQRVALAVLGFFLFGVCLGHMAYFGNSPLYRSLMLLLLLGVALNDIYAFTCGKLWGRRKLCPNTSPNKTVAGSVGALVCTTLTVTLLGLLVLPGAREMRWPHLVFAGVMLSVCGQLGDLMLSAIKRDVGLKDTGTLLPGHGGLLDRADSLLLAAPAAFHLVGFFEGVGLDMPKRILSGG